MKREDKSNLVSKLQSSIKEANGIFVIENSGLTVKEFESLREQLRDSVSLFKVVKNRIMKIALQNTEFSDISEFLKRPTAIAFANDSLSVVKVLAKFAEEHPKLLIIGGKSENKILNKDAIIQLSKLPSLLEIRSTIARLLIEPASRIARVSKEYGNSK